MKDQDKNKNLSALAGTLIFHGMLIILLLFLALKTPLPLPEEQGVEVNLGSSDEGSGNQPPGQVNEAKAAVPAPSKPEETKPVKGEEKLLTDDSEDNPSIAPAKKKPVPKKENKPVPEKPVNSSKPAEPAPPTVNPDALYKPSSGSSSGGQSQGITGKPGDQGKPEGDPHLADYSGTGGSGGGVSFDLGGRGALSLPKPSYDSREQGKVVVTVWVDRNGNVIDARDGAKGTTISDSHLRKIARDAALKAKFKADPDAPEKQTGTITYNFIRIN